MTTKRKDREAEAVCVLDEAIRLYPFNVVVRPIGRIELARVYFMSSDSSFAQRIAAE